MSLKLVIFDVDGLLLDTERVWQKVWKETAEKFKLHVDGNDVFLQVLGKSGPEVETILQNTLKDQCDASVFLEEARATGCKRILSELRLKRGAKEFITYLKENGYKLAIATSTSRELTEVRLKQVGVGKYFDFILCGDEVKKRKPHPEIYKRVLNEMHVDSQSALVLEDSYVGVEAAYRAGIPCIMVPDILPPTKNDLLRSKHIVKHLGCVQEMLINNCL